MEIGDRAQFSTKLLVTGLLAVLITMTTSLAFSPTASAAPQSADFEAKEPVAIEPAPKEPPPKPPMPQLAQETQNRLASANLLRRVGKGFTITGLVIIGGGLAAIGIDIGLQSHISMGIGIGIGMSLGIIGAVVSIIGAPMWIVGVVRRNRSQHQLDKLGANLEPAPAPADASTDLIHERHMTQSLAQGHRRATLFTWQFAL